MKKKNSLQLLVIVAFVLVSAVFGYLIVKEGLLIRKQSAEIYHIEAMIAEQQVLLQKLQDAQARTSEYEAHLSELQKMIPQAPDQNQFLVWVHQVSSDASLKLADVSFETHTQEAGYSVMPVKLYLQGSYNNTLQFLSSLMYGERLVRVDDVDLSGMGDNLSIEMKVNLFYKGNP